MKKLYSTLFLVVTVTTLVAQKKLTLEDIFLNNTFRLNTVSGFVPSTDGDNYYNYEGDDTLFVVKYSYKTGKALETVFSPYDLGITFSRAPYYGYEFSTDETKVLISLETERIYRHSTRSIYYVYDLKEKKAYKVADEKVRYATFSPDGSKVAYVSGNNLFYTDYKNDKSIQITTDGKDDAIINGAVDWVYEEEFAMSQGFEWSPDGKKIAFYRFDESGVKKYSMDLYGSLYPEQDVFKYPKAGEDNSVVDVKIYNLESQKTIDLNEGSENDQYIPRIQWTQDANLLSFQRMNRLQNKLEIITANATDGSLKTIYTETNKFYIDITDNLTFLNNGEQFIITSEKDGYNHLYLYDMEGKEVRQITKGNWEVDAFYGIDDKNKYLYFTSTEVSPTSRELYKTDIKGKKKSQLTKVESGMHYFTFNPSLTYYMDLYSSANKPYVQAIYNNDGKLVRELANNKALEETADEYGFSKVEFSNLTTGEGVELNYWMLKPKDFDPNKKYPLLMFVYGGPGNQQVINRWGGSNYYWYQYLAQQGYVIACVDNRGTGGRGEEFKKVTYKQLGKYETIDQIEAAKYFGKQNYIDANRIGIWGWSYGGYMSSLCITKGADVFKTAVAVAPVTNWRYYDNIYTERYMQRPQENASGYDDNSPINHVEKIKGNYLIIHGTADDNVHFQNTVEMVDAMINAGVKFDSEFYPNKNHSIHGRMTRYHLFSRITGFLLEKL